MQFTIDLSLFMTPWPYIALYVLGFFFAANVAAVKFKREDERRRGWGVDPMEYGVCAVFWPIYVLIRHVIWPLWKAFIWTLLLPSRLFR